MEARKSNSSVAGVSAWRRIKYFCGLSVLYLRRYRDGHDFSWLHDALDDYRHYLGLYGAKPLENSRVVEIGFGARPLRLTAMNALGIDATGVDLDRPIIRGTFSECLDAWRKNNVERAVKSIIRFWLNDRRERRAMFDSFGDRVRSRKVPVEKMVVSNASDPAFWQSLGGRTDLIVSEDVFEHIPVVDLEKIVAEMCASLSSDGLALIRPMIYSGISGGHQLEWYPHTIGKTMKRETEPWEHLRRDRHPANTYLNKLRRQEYRTLFEKHFEILEEREKQPDMGRDLMTPAIRDELSDYPDDELFSNNVLFVLKPRQPKA
jgi:hypothetical protein